MTRIQFLEMDRDHLRGKLETSARHSYQQSLDRAPLTPHPDPNEAFGRHGCQASQDILPVSNLDRDRDQNRDRIPLPDTTGLFDLEREKIEVLVNEPEQDSLEEGDMFA